MPNPLTKQDNLDYNGHLGGLIGGIFLAIIFPPPLM